MSNSSFLIQRGANWEAQFGLRGDDSGYRIFILCPWTEFKAVRDGWDRRGSSLRIHTIIGTSWQQRCQSHCWLNQWKLYRRGIWKGKFGREYRNQRLCSLTRILQSQELSMKEALSRHLAWLDPAVTHLASAFALYSSFTKFYSLVHPVCDIDQ